LWLSGWIIIIIIINNNWFVCSFLMGGCCLEGAFFVSFRCNKMNVVSKDIWRSEMVLKKYKKKKGGWMDGWMDGWMGE
jgi:hypothetical protein